MKKDILLPRLLAAVLLSLVCWTGLRGQATSQKPDPACFTAGPDSVLPTAAFFNYGTGNRMKNQTRRTKLTIGQPVVGSSLGDDKNTYFGFWTSFLVAPLPPMVSATQGDLLDRIQLTWSNNPLGPFPNMGFKIFRDGVFLAAVDSKTRNYNDFNVIAGKPYNYEVRGINIYGEGQPGKALGFQVPNGVVTGWVQTLNSSPVPDALVALTPLQGFSAKFGPYDGAFYADTSAAGFLPPAGEPWSLTFWLKNQAATPNAGILQLLPYTLNIRAIPSGGVTVDNGGPTLLSADFANDAWQHIALSYNDGQLRLYVNGLLAALAPASSINSADNLLMGTRTNAPGWEGRIDELRVYHKTLDELDLGAVMEATASSLTPGLKLYWKMDEEVGTKSFDILSRQKLYFCGAIFDKDRPAVRTAGITNEEGFYRIESASYGTGTTFLAQPMKNFYLHRSLLFDNDEQDYGTLPDFPMPPKATLELWVNSAGPDGEQCLLAKRWPGNDFRLLIKQNGLANNIWFYLNGQEHDFGTLGMGFQHLAFSIDSSGFDRTVTAYKNGVALGSRTFVGVSGSWSNPAEAWHLGARASNSGPTDFYGGLIDEVAVYDTTLAQSNILDHAQSSRDPQERGLRLYFSLDEGSGNRLNNSGSLLTGAGTGFGTTWSAFAPNQMTTPHVFSPKTRQVTLNPSVTSVDQVDFTDRSTVAVSGFVRYNGTDCFAQYVEILVNGESFNPPIFTDSLGRFVIDFDPGTTAILTPKFEDHLYAPAFWEVINVTNPVAGILFTDMTARKVKGRVAGGKCKRSVIQGPSGPPAICQVKVRSLDGCYENTQTVELDGTYEFSGLPPIEMTVAVFEHSDPVIKTAFEVQGGYQVDLTNFDTIVDFTYYAQPEIQFSGLDAYIPPNCTEIVLEQYDLDSFNIRLIETYYDGVCFIDSAALRINDGFGDVGLDTAMGGGIFKYKFRVGAPNPSPPYLKTFQVIATTLEDNETQKTLQALVTGLRAKTPTFTTKIADMPTLILRDPPGDGSYAFIEKGEQHCNSITMGTENDNTVNGFLSFDLGPKFEYDFPPAVPFEFIIKTDLDFTTTVHKVKENSIEVCRTANERISTSDGDLIVGSGQGGDVYMGLGLNVALGLADRVTFNDTTCSAAVKVVVSVSPEDFATTYIYSEYHLKNNVMRYLDEIIRDIKDDPGKPDADTLVYHQSRTNWANAIARNDTLKEKAIVTGNISFDANIAYEQSVTIDSSVSQLSGVASISGTTITQTFGAYVFGIGLEGGFGFDFANGKSETKGSGTSYSMTTGFALADDDPGDAFTVDIADDPVYRTPVFKLKYGQTSCPWEPGTAHREGNSLEFRDGSGPVVVDVPSNEAAVYKFTLGNNSETNETWTYAFTAGPESNPHGAVIKLNGSPLDKPVMYAIPYGESVPITVTLERGPEEYDYDSLELVLYSLCEDDRANALGILPDDDTILYSAQYITAHFIQPCSEVDITVPQQDWVVFPDPNTPGSDDVLRITVSGYDKAQADFDRIRVQYRRSDGDGAWINIVPPIDPVINEDQPGAEIVKDSLGDIFNQFYWNTDGLGDGPYEIRAVAVCTGDASDKPGYSHIIKGRIDRQPPSLAGVPEPADGVYNVGDEISFTFNKPVNCNRLIEADIFNRNNVGLYDATTDQLIDVDIFCYENKITLVPKFQNEFFENRILRAELDSIEDKTGNASGFFKWEFYVDRNELAWLTDSLGMTKYEDQTKTASASIHNRGGSPVSFSIHGIPDWVHVVPTQGTLAPNEIRPVLFEVDSTLGFGRWTDTITLHTETGQNPFFMGGDEGLPFGVRVVCRPPNWEIDEGLFENTMNMVLRLNIQGEFSDDVEDMVAAYIGDELRGRARVQYVPSLNTYLAYLTVYGDPDDVLDDLRLEVWDASACLRYGMVQEQFTFQPDNVIGIPDDPQVIHTDDLVLREVPFGYGWNWLSFNLAFPDNSLTAALASLHRPANDLIKSQTAFSTYSGGWFGALNNLNNTTMYIYRADLPDTLRMLGNLIDPATGIPLVSGWNWIGYLPNYSLPINEALSSLPSQKGDLIKSQLAFAQYLDANFGWVGNLKFMQPPNGYQIKVANPGMLVYPPPSQQAKSQPVAARGGAPDAFWSVNPAQYEYSMTLIGMLAANGANATGSTMELGAFAGNELRGAAQAVYIEPLNAYQFFLTTYANASGEQLHFKLFDGSNGSVQALSETMYFSPELHQGSIENPLPFTLLSTGTAELSKAQSFEVQPNPFSNQTAFRFALPQAETVVLSITDAQGREVSLRRVDARAGLNVIDWDGRSDAGHWLGSGVYLVRLQTELGSVSRKVVLQRLP
ncbi:MAG: T9SS type A sorting domain-containing protein [Saprospiraceae bacterium]|nr:T9SS type A sorting domain-containing protein [Saprospiraceae bacterium]